jgi:hypothetical protein
MKRCGIGTAFPCDPDRFFAGLGPLTPAGDISQSSANSHPFPLPNTVLFLIGLFFFSRHNLARSAFIAFGRSIHSAGRNGSTGAEGPRDIGKCTRLPAFILWFGSQEECAS